MKIGLVGPGIMPIPPTGWGAVEILIWQYYTELVKKGHDVVIINKMRQNDKEQKEPTTTYCQELIKEINQGEYDFIHIHYDCLYHIMPYLTARSVGITSHFPYIDQYEKHTQYGFANTFSHMCNNERHSIFAVSQKDMETFKAHCKYPERVFLMLNATDSEKIQPVENGRFKHRSIYVGNIEPKKINDPDEPRKQQYKYASLQNLDFYGKCFPWDPFYQLPHYKGEYQHDIMMKIMAEYGNLVLLSIGENGTPLVVKEALMAGLPVVINKHSINDIDITKPYIDVIPDDKLNDMDYIQHVIETNREKQDKEAIRSYAMKNFSWTVLIDIYLQNIELSLSNIQS